MQGTVFGVGVPFPVPAPGYEDPGAQDNTLGRMVRYPYSLVINWERAGSQRCSDTPEPSECRQSDSGSDCGSSTEATLPDEELSDSRRASSSFDCPRDCAHIHTEDTLSEGVEPEESEELDCGEPVELTDMTNLDLCVIFSVLNYILLLALDCESNNQKYWLWGKWQTELVMRFAAGLGYDASGCIRIAKGYRVWRDRSGSTEFGGALTKRRAYTIIRRISPQPPREKIRTKDSSNAQDRVSAAVFEEYKQRATVAARWAKTRLSQVISDANL